MANTGVYSQSSVNQGMKEILESYFERINYLGTKAASLDTLKALHLLHPKAIPFENLDSLMGRTVSLDLQSLKKKLVDEERGGYCFEHNLLFKFVLDTLKFNTRSLGGRVVWEGT